ncbi:PREDICTED: uncharacterized protein LOC101816284 isoform X2 [Ficedula albicollis]|nr:PREDICTED: uncharacterized protein LOC101816284 isoform X2 [Ficedula albicollis]
MCPQLSASRPAFTMRVPSSSGRLVSARCPFLRYKACPRCGGDIHAEGVQENGTSEGNKPLPDPRCGNNRVRCLIAQCPSVLGRDGEMNASKPLALVSHLRKNSVPRRQSPPPGGVLRASGPGATPAPSQTPGSARRSVTGTTENNKGKGCGVGKARTGSPSAKLSSSPAAAVRVAPGLCRAAQRSAASAASAVLHRARACERGGTGQRLRGDHRRKPTEDAQRTKMCPQCSSERHRGIHCAPRHGETYRLGTAMPKV